MTKIKHLFQVFFETLKQTTLTTAYRVTEIEEIEAQKYIVTIQVINRNIFFKVKPEELLAQDDLVNQFSPCDIRTLTYLGYLSINSPEYKILAQRTSEKNNKVLFAIQQKDNKKVITKTADEILKDKDILNNLDGKDSHLVGYTIATENMLYEKKAKEKLLRLKEIKRSI